MRDKLIRFLGGRTEEEYLLLTKEYDSQRELVITYRAREERLIDDLKEERTERKQLQELIFKRFGISYSEDENSCGQISENLQPVSNGSQRWSNLRARLEKDDSLRMRETGANQ
jgi:hypothetical protein